jgi:hypothetical protein
MHSPGEFMPETVVIPMAFFEALIEFERPDFRLLANDRVPIVQSLFEAFSKWDIKVDDMEVISTGKISDQGIKFKIPAKQATFFFTASGCRFTRDNTSWQTADETIELLDSGLKTIFSAARVKPAKFRTAVALHIQPKNRPFIDILRKLAPGPMINLDRSEPQTLASVMVWPQLKITIDGSSRVANGIFIKFEHEFAGAVTYQDMAAKLKADENAIFSMLDVAEEV